MWGVGEKERAVCIQVSDLTGFLRMEARQGEH